MRGGEYRISFTTVDTDTDTDKVLDAFKDRLQQCTDTFYNLQNSIEFPSGIPHSKSSSDRFLKRL